MISITEEQKEKLINAFKAARSGDITEEQYKDVRRMLMDELLEETPGEDSGIKRAAVRKMFEED